MNNMVDGGEKRKVGPEEKGRSRGRFGLIGGSTQTAPFGFVYLGRCPAALGSQSHRPTLTQSLHGLPHYVARLWQGNGWHREVGQ